MDLMDGSGTPVLPQSSRRRSHWRSNLRLTTALMVVWFVVTFMVSFFARELDFVFFGWPFSVWMAAQGMLATYLIIVGFYAWRMNRLDHEHGVSEEL